MAPRFGRNPIYTVTLHESSYADGVPTRWSARRTMPDQAAEALVHRRAHLSVDVGGLLDAPRIATPRTLLAEHPWPRLYDADQARLLQGPSRGDDLNDLYVERAFADETAARDAAVGRSEYEHNGLRADGERVLGRLIDLVREPPDARRRLRARPA